MCISCTPCEVVADGTTRLMSTSPAFFHRRGPAVRWWRRFFFRRPQALQHILGIPRCAETDHDVAFIGQGGDLPGKNIFIAEIVGDAGECGAVAIERDRRQGTAGA